MGILKDNIKKDIRFKQGDFELYEPKAEMKEELRRRILEASEMTEDGEGSSFLDISTMRIIYRELTNIGEEIDEYTDTEVDLLTETHGHNFFVLYSEIEKLLNEIADEIVIEREKSLNTLIKGMDALVKTKDMIDIKEKFNKMMKKAGVDISYDDIANKEANPTELQDKLKVGQKKTTKGKAKTKNK